MDFIAIVVGIAGCLPTLFGFTAERFSMKFAVSVLVPIFQVTNPAAAASDGIFLYFGDDPVVHRPRFVLFVLFVAVRGQKRGSV